MEEEIEINIFGLRAVGQKGIIVLQEIKVLLKLNFTVLYNL